MGLTNNSNLRELRKVSVNDDFSESSLHNIFKTHLEEMQAILIKHSISFQDVINMYQASYECNDIYNSFRGDKIE